MFQWEVPQVGSSQRRPWTAREMWVWNFKRYKQHCYAVAEAFWERDDIFTAYMDKQEARFITMFGCCPGNPVRAD